MEPKGDIALIGLAVMGQNLILNMNDNGWPRIGAVLPRQQSAPAPEPVEAYQASGDAGQFDDMDF